MMAVLWSRIQAWSNWGLGCDEDHSEQQLCALRKDRGVSAERRRSCFYQLQMLILMMWLRAGRLPSDPQKVGWWL